MVIIFEGANKVGKTTLAQGLVMMLSRNGHQAQYIRVRPDDVVLELMKGKGGSTAAYCFIKGMQEILSNLMHSDTIYIVDRFDVTEFIYGQEREYDIKGLIVGLHEDIIDDGAKYVFVTSDMENVGNLHEKANLKELQTQFYDFFENRFKHTEDNLFTVNNEITSKDNNLNMYVSTLLSIYMWAIKC
jgi:hypothetical protein